MAEKTPESTTCPSHVDNRLFRYAYMNDPAAMKFLFGPLAVSSIPKRNCQSIWDLMQATRALLPAVDFLCVLQSIAHNGWR